MRFSVVLRIENATLLNRVCHSDNEVDVLPTVRHDLEVKLMQLVRARRFERVQLRDETVMRERKSGPRPLTDFEREREALIKQILAQPVEAFIVERIDASESF